MLEVRWIGCPGWTWLADMDLYSLLEDVEHVPPKHEPVHIMEVFPWKDPHFFIVISSFLATIATGHGYVSKPEDQLQGPKISI